MKKTTLVFIILALIALVIFFFPKSSGSGGSCADCKIMQCKCFGFKKDWSAIGPWRSTCYGVPYKCETYIN